jgi:leader peptidase (prepilin peptidase) / N-methyltransferase
MTSLTAEIIIFIFGLCIGSFLNVCICRLPANKSIVFPGSACPDCGTSIRAYDNIPLLSYIWLKGRCRQCSTRIPLRYPTVEIMGGAFAVLAYLKFGFTWEALIYYGFVAALLIITFIDIDYQIIPDIISLPGIPLGFAASFAIPGLTYSASLLGILVGGGMLYLIAWGYHLITKKEGMGGGDIKLLGMIGAFIGWQGVLFTIFVASAVGTISGLLVMMRQKEGLKLAIPFGPFLSIGAIAYVFMGPALVTWYFSLLM